MARPFEVRRQNVPWGIRRVGNAFPTQLPAMRLILAMRFNAMRSRSIMPRMKHKIFRVSSLHFKLLFYLMFNDLDGLIESQGDNTEDDDACNHHIELEHL